MPRLVRRKPLLQRIYAHLNPMDALLWLSEEMETRDWDSAQLGTQLGLGMNFVFLLARANHGSESANDDVFGEEQGRSWTSLIIFPLVWGLVALSVTNAVYTISRTRKYRMFEANIDVQPATTSARRVSVQSTSATSSPLRFISNIITPEAAESRAHPDKSRDVWELSVWDPLPVSLRLFCLFSPGHVLVYLVFLPLAPLDPRPSMTIFNTILMQLLLSCQMVLISSRFTQQARDNSIIQKEVMHEYDTKFVHPLLHPVVRDVGIQTSDDLPDNFDDIVEIGTPTTLIRRTFRTNGNPHIDATETVTSTATNTPIARPQMFTPSTAPRKSDTFLTPSTSLRSAMHRSSLPAGRLPGSVSTNALPHTTSAVGPFADRINTVHARAISPLKKTVSLHELGAQENSPRFGLNGFNDENSNELMSSPIPATGPRQPGRKSFSAGSQQLNAARQRNQQENSRPRW